MTDSTTDDRRERFREALIALHAGRPEKALRPLQDLHEEAPHDSEVALNLGGTYIMLLRYEDAQEVLERAATQAPENANIWINLAAARLGPLEQSSDEQQIGAIDAYQQALHADPETPNVHYMLGLIHRHRGDTLRASAHFARAIDSDPTDRDARKMLDSLEGPTTA